MVKKVIILTIFLIIIIQCVGCIPNSNKVVPEKVTKYGGEAALTKEAVDYFATLWKNAEWTPGITKTSYNYVIECNVTTIRYVADYGLFNDVANDRHCYVSEEDRIYINSLLSDMFKQE